MAHSRFSIGIDLGTTNCAMAFESLDVADATGRDVPNLAMGKRFPLL